MTDIGGLTIYITAGHREQPCGCASWLEYQHDTGTWAAREYICMRHDSQGTS